MDHEISLGFLLRVLKKTWWKIAIFAVAILLIVAAFTEFCIPKKYSSSIEFYVVNTNTSYDYTTSSLLSASAYLINDYVSIMKSDYMLDRVGKELVAMGYAEADVTAPKLRSMISSSTDTEYTSVFDVRVTHTSTEFAYDVATVIKNLAPDLVTEVAKPDRLTNGNLAQTIHSVMKYYDKEIDGEQGVTVEEIEQLLIKEEVGLTASLSCIEVLTPPVVDKAHDSPNVFTYSVLGAMIAAVVAYLFFLAKSIFELSIASEDDIKKMINRPLIGTVPHWDLNAGKK